jgi:hypothetical protein
MKPNLVSIIFPAASPNESLTIKTTTNRMTFPKTASGTAISTIRMRLQRV